MGKNEKQRLRPVEMPLDDEFYYRPFFAYGIFKKGQLAHSRIADCVDHVEHGEIPHEMHIRDGVPVIIKEEDDHIAKGDKIYFLDDRMDEAYGIISNTQPGNIYKWDTEDIDGQTFNVLVTENLKGTYVNSDDDGEYQDYFDGRKDPFFSKVTEFIRNELKEMEYNEEAIFKFQMYYMLLWSAIERYCVLKYDVSQRQGAYLDALAEDEVYIEALKSVNPEWRHSVHSAKNATPFYFDLEKPNFIIHFYYNIRCNVAHRGKEIRNNIAALRKALCDLLKIFDYIIKNTFDEGN